MTLVEARGKALIATAEQIAEINDLLPSWIRVAPVAAFDGRLQLGADLLTDCGEGGTYEAAATILEALEVTAWTDSVDSD